MSPHGRALLEQREGNILHAYQDTVGVWTIGYGHTHFDGAPIPVAGMKLTQQQADDMLTKDLTRYENIVNNNIKVPLKQNQFDALVSICYNVESALAPRSSIVRAINANDMKTAADAIMLYNKPPEIVGRRRTEQKQFMTPYPSTTGSLKGAVVVGAATVAAANHPHIWPWILGATLLVAIGFGIYEYIKYKGKVNVG